MAEKKDGLTRRDFMKTVGLGGLAAAGIDSAGAITASAQAAEKTASVPKRKLGKTGAEISILSLGGMIDTVNNQLLIRQAFGWGVNCFDTAEAYGNGLSEEGFGRFFARNPDARKDIFLTTKLKASTPDNLSAGIDKSLKRLNTDYVDLFCIHGVGDLKEIDPSIRDWASRMKKSGKIKFFGLSTHTNMEDCLLASSKADWMDAVMFAYNFRLMHTQKMKDAVDACAAAGVGLIAMKTQGGGPVKGGSEAEAALIGKLMERGFNDKQAKLKAVWENPKIASICSQMPNLYILSANVAASRDLTRLSSSDLQLLENFAGQTRESYCAGCANICVVAVCGLVPVNDVLRCLMYYRDYGERELAREIFGGFPGEVRERICETDYSIAELNCPQGIRIAKLMREASTLLG